MRDVADPTLRDRLVWWEMDVALVERDGTQLELVLA